MKVDPNVWRYDPIEFNGVYWVTKIRRDENPFINCVYHCMYTSRFGLLRILVKDRREFVLERITDRLHGR